MQAPSNMKILLAEDDNDMRRFLARALQNAGYDVIAFDNGLSAYNRLREEPFELLLTDIVMPEMDGIELARRATELDPDIKVMFIPALRRSRSIRTRRRRRTPRCFRSPFTCATWSTRSRSSSRLEPRRLSSLHRSPRAVISPPHAKRADPSRIRARSSAGEHYVDIVGVTGSIPVAPTINFNHLASLCEFFQVR